MIDFLLSSNCCILNGRNTVNNDFTYRDISVIDYCIMPYEQLNYFRDFQVHRSMDLFEAAGCVGAVANPAHVISDHNLIMWKLDLPVNITSANSAGGCTPIVSYVKYDLTNIPPDFLQGGLVQRQIDEYISIIENRVLNQERLNEMFDGFCNCVKSEMNEKLSHRTVRVVNGLSNKRRRVKKPYWTDDLSMLWNRYAEAEKKASQANGREKQRLRAVARGYRDALDRNVQAAKRKYWREMQDSLLKLQTENPKEYWRFIGKIGVAQERSNRIPWEVIDADGVVKSDPDSVIKRWKNDFEKLLNSDEDSAQEPELDPPPPEPPPVDTGLDNSISLQEVQLAVRVAKCGKAMGWDEIPVEVLKNDSAVRILFHMFKACFDTGIIPECWQWSIVNPIPKSSTSDPRDPLNYRGITLASAVYKLYAGILNRRLTAWSEQNGKVGDEQNGFRAGRSCIDHLSTLSQLIDTRKQQNLSTFVAYIDFSKAYDRINRGLLWSKLDKMGISPKFMLALKSLYRNVKSSVKINGVLSEWFDVNVGLKQGCLISPQLFNLYINDLITDIQNLGLGVPIDEEKISILLYADDIALVATNEIDLQQMLSVLHNWCMKWKMKVNPSKTQVMHFRRGPSVTRSQFKFVCGNDQIQTVDKYRYLGLIFTEFLSYDAMAKSVAQSATRALGLVIAKVKSHGGVPFKVFTQLYDALVQPIIDYGASVWGNKEHSCIKAVQHRASRFYLGLGKYAPVAGVVGEMGWKQPAQKVWKAVTRQWCRLSNMPTTRLNARVFVWARRKALGGVKSGCKKIIDFYKGLDVWNTLQPPHVFDIDSAIINVDCVMTSHFENQWLMDVCREEGITGRGRNKLRTYRLFKTSFGTSHYVKDSHLTGAQRSAMAKMRCGVAPIRLETGRYENLNENERICPMCNSGAIESEEHVMISCSLYNDVRNDLFNTAQSENSDFNAFSNRQKFLFLMDSVNIVRYTAKACHQILYRRRRHVYIND